MTTRLLITLDYELFFGQRVGTVKHCMLRPVEALMEVLDQHRAKLTLFVDAGYLHQLRLQGGKVEALTKDYRQIREQLQRLVEAGHDVQLHIHPHWEESRFETGEWRIDSRRYRLHDFAPEQRERIVADYKQALTDIVGDRIFAYRAGGWCLQPFEVIGETLLKHGIWLDSTVYAMGYSPDSLRGFDFRGAPEKPFWRFDKDPLREERSGRFLELPITSCKVSPLFYWKLALQKKFARGAFRSFGDGSAMVANAAYYRQLLTRSSYSVASIDGAKAGLLEQAYRQLERGPAPSIFNIMGHPKALSPYSLEQLDRFLGRHPELTPVTLQAFRDLQP